MLSNSLRVVNRVQWNVSSHQFNGGSPIYLSVIHSVHKFSKIISLVWEYPWLWGALIGRPTAAADIFHL